MKFLVALILTALLSFIGGLYMPWWSIALAAFLTAILVHQKPWKALLAGFFSVFLLWGILAEWIDLPNESILSGRIGELLGIGNHPFILVLITGFIGGLIGGFAALSGSYLRKSK